MARRDLIGLDVRSNLRQWSRGMTRIEREQLPFGTALALTRTAEDIKKNTEKTLARRLDRPTPFTQRGLFLLKATKRKLVASVGFKTIQSGYLNFVERGGTRLPKRRAIVLPEGVRLNRYGNMPRGKVGKLLARKDTFSGTVGGTPGIWQRTKGRLKLLVAYVGRASYRPQLHFMSSAYKTAQARFYINFRRAMDYAVRSAR